MSLFRHKNTLQSIKYIEKKRKIMFASIILSLFCILLLILNIILFSRLSFTQISEIEINGINHISKDELNNSILENINGKYFGIIPKSSIFFFPKEDIEKSLILKYKIINNLNIKRIGLSKIELNINERIPKVIVCDGFRDDNAQDNCFLSDYRGYVYNKAEIEDIENIKYNKYYVPNSKESIIPGISFIDEKVFNELEDFLASSRREGLSPLGILIGENGEYEMYIKNIFLKESTSTPDITVYFDDKIPLKTTFSNLITFWKDAIIKNKDANLPIFNSINLHFGNTIYYSKQNNE